MHRKAFPSSSAWLFPAGVSSPPHFRMSTRDGPRGALDVEDVSCGLVCWDRLSSIVSANRTRLLKFLWIWESIEIWKAIYNEEQSIKSTSQFQFPFPKPLPHYKTTSPFQNHLLIPKPPPYSKTTSSFHNHLFIVKRPPHSKTTSPFQNHLPIQQPPPYSKTTSPFHNHLPIPQPPSLCPTNSSFNNWLHLNIEPKPIIFQTELTTKCEWLQSVSASEHNWKLNKHARSNKTELI